MQEHIYFNDVKTYLRYAMDRILPNMKIKFDLLKLNQTNQTENCIL